MFVVAGMVAACAVMLVVPLLGLAPFNGGGVRVARIVVVVWE